MLGRIMGIAQTIEVFAVLEGAQAAIDVARARSGRWFDPALVRGLDGLEPELARWCQLDEQGLQEVVREREPGDAALLAGPGSLDRIAEGFAAVVDAKSPYTGRHSARVTGFALAVAGEMGFHAHDMGELRRAGLLHDIGKLSVPNSILDKPTKLSSEEWETMRLHPYYTQRILEQINGFEEMTHIAASHHERIDGRGYHRGLRGDAIPLGGKLLAVADVFEALTSNRPYRPALPDDLALAIMEKDRGIGLDGDCLDALTVVLRRGSEYELRAGAEVPATPVPPDALTRFVAEPAAMAAKEREAAATITTIEAPVSAPITPRTPVVAPAAPVPEPAQATVRNVPRPSSHGPRQVPVEADDYWIAGGAAPPDSAKPDLEEDEEAA
jgi:putative nucleotidyltransferase with HDIG domain